MLSAIFSTRICIRARSLSIQFQKYINPFQCRSIPITTKASLFLNCRHVGKSNLEFIAKSYFHTTPRRYNPIISTIARQIFKVATIFIGRSIRNWWKTLPVSNKKDFKSWLLKHKWKFINSMGIIIATMAFYYYSHIQETPITKRRRFIAFTPEQFSLLNKLELESQLEVYNSKLLPNEHKSTQRVAKVAKQLLDRNKDIEQIKSHEWSVSVIDDENTMNAFVLPSGNIFVFTGLLKICENDDQLGIVLAHEISHAILAHGLEMISHAHIVDMVFIGIIGFLWMLLPTDFIASIGTAASRLILRIALDTPYSKMLETEADEVGLTLAAKSCFDVREASAFWYKMSIVQKETSEMPEVPVNFDFLTTHPSHEKRCEHLNDLMQVAIQSRTDCGCSPLSKIDPRERVKLLHDKIAAEYKQKKYEGVLKIGDL